MNPDSSASDERSPLSGDEDNPVVRASIRAYESLIDRHIAQAHAEGLFNNLPGTGKPLPLDDDMLVPPEERAAYRLLKNSGFAPPWIELQKEIGERQAKLEAWIVAVRGRWAHLPQTQRDAARDEVRERVAELNTLITSYNLSAPRVAGQLPLLQLWREQAKLG